MSVRLVAVDPESSRGHVYAVVRAYDGDALVFADRVALDRADDRRAFAREVVEHVQTADAAAIEAELLRFYDEAAPISPASDDLTDSQKAQSQAAKLVELASDAELFHTPEGEPFATIPVGPVRQTWPLKARGFRDWQARRYFERYEAAANSQAIADSLGVLRGKALFQGPELPVFVRLAEQGGAIYLDLANDAWQAIEITAGGWRVVTDPPVKFRRTRGMLPLPIPSRGGSVEDLWRFINVEGRDRRLLLSWLIMAFRPIGPYPVLLIHGEQGSAKSTVGRVLRSLVDPNVALLRARPRDEVDLLIAATNGAVVGYDNLSFLSDDLSDAICRLATGGSLGKRELYSDADEVLFSVMRPVILNAIEDLAIRGDLADRGLSAYLPRIT